MSLLRQARRMRKEQLSRVAERFQLYGDVYRLHFLGRDRYVTRSPEHFREVLIERALDFQKPCRGPAARQLRRFLGDGLLTSNGELWRNQRRLIQPAFRKERLDAYADMAVTLAERRLAGWQAGTTLEVSREMGELTLGIACKTLFDHEIRGEEDRVAAAMNVFRRSFSDLSAVLPSYVPWPSKLRLARAVDDVDAVIDRLLDAPCAAEREDLLASLRAGALSLDRKQLRDELLTLLVAGHETTAHALSWTFHLLARHPAVEARLVSEVQRVLGARRPGYGDLPRLQYTEQVLSESLRLFPPAYALLRTCARDSRMGPYEVRAGTDLVLWVYHAQRDARWFTNPERFEPERFGPERRKSIPAGAYLPFGAGTRTCIGKQLAIMEATLILACVVQRFSLREEEPTHVLPEASLTLAPRGLRLRILERGPAESTGQVAETIA